MLRALGRALVMIVPLLWPGSGAATSPTGDAAAALKRDVRALEAELKLAGTAKVYLVLDARDATVRIKAAGLTLKTLPVTRWSSWGTPVTPTPRRLVRRSALIEPRRPTITPEAAGQPDGEAGALASARTDTTLDALELKDMPARFHLVAGQGVRIAVRPEPEGFLSRWWERAHYTGWYLTRPFPTVWHRLRGQPYTALYLRIAAQDARALYWACREGADLLVIDP